jgi:hypothetical protein
MFLCKSCAQLVDFKRKNYTSNCSCDFNEDIHMRNRQKRKKILMTASAGAMALGLLAVPLQWTSFQFDTASVARAADGGAGNTSPSAGSGGDAGGLEDSAGTLSRGPESDGADDRAASKAPGVSEAKAPVPEPALEMTDSVGGLY